jgi:hypothetical protein
MDEQDGFFRQEGDTSLPQPIARGPWDPASLNGRVVAGLLGCELEARHGEEGWLPARLTVDLYRLPGFDPVAVETRMVREGRRIRVVDATFVSGGRDCARATCQFLRQGENAAGAVWKPEPWTAPPPDTVPDRVREGAPPWIVRPFSGGFGTAERRRAWLKELRPMVADRAITPYARVAAMADFVSPWAHSGDQGLGYINTDVGLTLHRLPVGEWIGFEANYHDADAGVAVGECRLYDETGPIGLATCVALAQAQALRPR